MSPLADLRARLLSGAPLDAQERQALARLVKDVEQLAKIGSTAEPAALVSPSADASATVEAWYSAYVARHSDAVKFPTRDEDWAALVAAGYPVSREDARELRRKFAPAEWQRKGRPSKKCAAAHFANFDGPFLACSNGREYGD